MTDKYIICDIDGTISDDFWRRNLIPSHPDATSGDDPYDAYNNQHSRDGLLQSGHAILYGLCAQHFGRLARECSDRIIFITARPEKFRSSTTNWLKDKLGLKSAILFMRPEGNLERSPELKMRLLKKARNLMGFEMEQVVAILDDRPDVMDAFSRHYDHFGVDWEGRLHLIETRPLIEPAVKSDHQHSPADILAQMADTFRERNKVYGDNYKRVGEIMKALFPQGVALESVAQFNQWHLFELMIVKLTRFANSGLTHKDSIHDLAVYAAMVEFLTEEKEDD